MTFNVVRTLLESILSDCADAGQYFFNNLPPRPNVADIVLFVSLLVLLGVVL